MKMVIVGGASTYTPELIDGLARMHDVLPVDEVVLVDPQADRLALVHAVSQRMIDALGRPYRVRAETDLVRALEGADVVLIQLRVGGQAVRVSDEKLPLPLGCIGQETTGVGGLAKALRTVPVVVEIAETIRQHAPNAWIIDFTNPVGIVTRALLNAGHRAVGLCNVAIGMQYMFAELLEQEPSQVSLTHVGLNHLSWEVAVRVGGIDHLPTLIEQRADEIAQRMHLPAELIHNLGVVPSYYLRYYYFHDEELDKQRSGPIRAEEVQQIERELLTLYADPTVVSKPELLTERGGALYSESAVELMASLVGSRPGRHVVNARNAGVLDFLPDDAIIEVAAEVSGGSIQPESGPPAPPVLRGLISDVYAYEELALEAAVEGGRERVVRALVAHPLIRQWDLARQLADRVLAENRTLIRDSR